MKIISGNLIYVLYDPMWQLGSSSTLWQVLSEYIPALENGRLISQAIDFFSLRAHFYLYFQCYFTLNDNNSLFAKFFSSRLKNKKERKKYLKVLLILQACSGFVS